jgi:hypothetical protein
VRGESDRPNIAYGLCRCVAKEPALIPRGSAPKRPMIVLRDARRKRTDGDSPRRAFWRDTVRFYHAGLRAKKKTVERWFFGKTNAILNGNVRFRDGIDKKDIYDGDTSRRAAVRRAYVQERTRRT